MTTKSQVLQLCEVEIYSRENLAFGKLTDQKDTAHGGLSSRGVDGNSKTTYSKGSCTHTPWEFKPWWRVDLGQVEPVSEVYIVNRGHPKWAFRLSNFEIRVGSETSGGGVTNPKCGSGYSVPSGEGKSFFCRPPMYGRYVTIRSLLNEALTLCEVEVYSERRACQIQALGVSSKTAFTDNSFSASSRSSSNVASKGRLNGPGAWSPSSNNNPNDYLQINLQYEYFICAVATQGKSTEDHWTTKFKLHLSLNSVDWVTYKENGTAKVFHGNSGRNDTVKHNLKEIARARFIQFQPTNYSTYKALRVEVFGILKPAAPSQAPASFVVSALSSTSVRASWQLPPAGSRHGAITGFKLFYQRKNSAADYPTVMTIESGSTLSRDITGLHKYTAYEFQVLAFSSVGNGPKSSVQEVRTNEDVPSKAPSNFTAAASSSTSITVSWQLPPKDFRHGIIIGFKLFYKMSSSAESPDVKIIRNPMIMPRDITGLKKYTEYEFQVLARTSAGDGLESAVEVKRTFEDAPSAPVSFGYTHITPSSSHGPRINLTWSKPAEPNGVIRNYTLSYSHSGKTPNEISGIDGLSYTVDVLGGIQFQFHVRAVTIKPGTKALLVVDIPEYNVGATDKTKGSDSVSAVEIAVPVVLLILLIPAVLASVFFYRRRKRPENKSSNGRANPVQLEDLGSGSTDTTSSTANLVYQNLVDIRPPEEGTSDVMEASSPKENESIYSEAEDGKPKPIPVADFAKYFKNKSSNGAIALREEFKNLPGGMQFPWEVGLKNKIKNRYGNITTYDHSRVVLEKAEGDRHMNSDYINASFIPTFDEETMCYIATQGPTSVTFSDFWRMISQEKCGTVVMLTNLVEVGKGKCDQYWPDSTTKYGSIRVTLQKTENFADYVVRTFILVKGSGKREVLQFHYITWPDKGVPQRSTALLGFRWKVHTRHLATGGPLVVHCSAGVGRTGTYIGIDAMLVGAKEKKSVFIQNYVQVMRRYRPHMVQKEEQYVFWHRAVMEALTCGNTEIAPQGLRIAMKRLARTHTSSKQTGYEQEFKRLQLVSDCQASGEESVAAFKPSNIKKNRFPNIVPLDSARVFLRSSDPQKDYINASFVDDYKQRNAYILTQAPLDNTIEDFWRMISQYDIGTIVMLNSLREEKESYPPYWPTKGSVKYSDITIEFLSESTSNKVTTRRFSVMNAEPPKKQSTVQHLHFTGWSNLDSCPDPQEILDLLTVVQQSQQQTRNGVIVFQCSDGDGRSGCVSSIMSVIERVKSEQTVDVFQTIKLIRAKRPGAVDTLEKYVFCYKTILAYLDSFNAYANFADC